jgi:MFS family permease
MIPLLYLGLLGGIQGADPNIASTALLSASTDLKMGSLAALAASISTFMLAATVITTGMLADRIGRKKILCLALVTSAVGDVLAAAAPDPGVFLAGRALAGIGLGAVYGASFAYVRHYASSKGGIAGALGIFSAAASAAALLFTFVGATLVGVDWRVAFLLIPVASLASIPVALVLLPPDTKWTGDAPWDVLGQLLLGFGVIAMLYGISHAGVEIASALTVGPIVVGVLLLVGFAAWEHHMGEPGFFPVGVFRQPLFLVAIMAGLIYNLSCGALLLSYSNLFQYAYDLRGLTLSLMQLPNLVAGIFAALIAGRLIGGGRLSRHDAIFIGAAITAAGCLLFGATALARPASVLAYVPALIIVGIGPIVPAVPYGGLVLEFADPRHYGAVSSSRTTIGQFFYAIGLAGSTVIIDTLTRGAVQSKLGSSAVVQLDTWSASGTKPSDPGVLAAASEAFTGSFATLMVVLTVIVLVAGVLALALARVARRRAGASSSGPSSAPGAAATP